MKVVVKRPSSFQCVMESACSLIQQWQRFEFFAPSATNFNALEFVVISLVFLCHVLSLFLIQSVKYPKAAYSYLQDLLAKKLDNPLVKQYQERFPYYDLIEDSETNSIAFKHDE